MKAVSATMLSPNFFLECAVHNLIPTLSSVSCVTVARVVQERRNRAIVRSGHRAIENEDDAKTCRDGQWAERDLRIAKRDSQSAIRNCSKRIHQEGDFEVSRDFVFRENEG